MTRHRQHLKVEVLKKDGYWVRAPGRRPPEACPATHCLNYSLRSEYSKYVCLWVPHEVPVSVEYLAADPAIRAELELSTPPTWRCLRT